MNTCQPSHMYIPAHTNHTHMHTYFVPGLYGKFPRGVGIGGPGVSVVSTRLGSGIGGRELMSDRPDEEMGIG